MAGAATTTAQSREQPSGPETRDLLNIQAQHAEKADAVVGCLPVDAAVVYLDESCLPAKLHGRLPGGLSPYVVRQ